MVAAIRGDDPGKRGTPGPGRRTRAERAVGPSHADQQRRDVRQHPADHPPWRRLVRRHRHREEQGHQGLRADRQGPQHRSDRGADGHDAAAHRRGDGRRRARTAARSRRCRRAAPRAAASRPSMLDTPVDYESLHAARLDHGLGRHDRHGPGHQHGRRGPVLHGVLHGRVVRQVHPLPRGHRADVSAADAHRRRARRRRADLAAAGGLCDMVKHTSLCGLGQTAPNPVLSTLRYFRHEYEALLHEARCEHGEAAEPVADAAAIAPPQGRPRGINMAVMTLTIDGS